MLLIKRFFWAVGADDANTSRSPENRGSTRDYLGKAADMYADMKTAENLQKTADELERIRYQMSRKK